MPRQSERERLLSQTDIMLDNPEFRQSLHTLLQEHYSLLRKQQAQHQIYLQLLRSPLDNEFVVLLLETLDKKHLTYLPNQLVPDRFEELERNGHVHCSHGPTADAGLGPRTITLTPKGKEIAEHHARIRAAYQTQETLYFLIAQTDHFHTP